MRLAIDPSGTRPYLSSAMSKVLQRAVRELRVRARSTVARWVWIGWRRAGRCAADRLAPHVRALRREIVALDPIDASARSPTIGAFWNDRRRRLRQLLLREDPLRFLTWDVIATGMTMGNHAWVRTELRSLQHSPDWTTRWRPVLNEDPIGFPMPFLRYPRSSGTLIHHAYHVQQFEQATGREITDFAHILEFGGGYGDMRRLIGRLGYRGGYHIHDLPELVALQRFYLAALAQYGRTASLGGDEYPTTFSTELNQVITPSELDSSSLFLATWSLSETPLELRDAWQSILAQFSFFLFGYADRFEGVDNTRWFGQYTASRPDVRWHRWAIPHRPRRTYLIGAPAEKAAPLASSTAGD